MSSSTSFTTSITPLNNSNYPTWKLEVTALLRTKRLFRLVNGNVSKLVAKDGDDSSLEKLETYLDKLEQAAGILILTVGQD